MNDIVAGLRELSEPWPTGSKVKEAIDRASKAVKFSYWRASDIWYGKARRIEEYEYAAVAEALDKKRREAARNELHELRTRLTRLESMLVQSDPDFHRESIDVARTQVRSMGGARGGLDRAMDRVKGR